MSNSVLTNWEVDKSSRCQTWIVTRLQIMTMFAARIVYMLTTASPKYEWCVEPQAKITKHCVSALRLLQKRSQFLYLVHILAIGENSLGFWCLVNMATKISEGEP